MKRIIEIITLLAVSLLLAARQVFAPGSGRYSGLELLANESCPEGRTTRYAQAAITAKGILVKQGTAANQVTPCGANDLPLALALDAAVQDDTVPIALLGATPGTLVAIASEAITQGEEVFTAASGKLQDLPVGAGTYYSVGYAYTAASGDNVEFEIIPHTPRKLVV
jgi:hypothetical protein